MRVLVVGREGQLARALAEHSRFQANFVRTMLRLAATRDELRVVADQVGSPTSALDLADAILGVSANLLARPDDRGLRGVFHVTAGWSMSWADFARRLFAEPRRFAGPSADVVSIPTTEYPTPARRPAFSVLDGAALRERHGVSLPEGPASLSACVERLIATMKTEG